MVWAAMLGFLVGCSPPAPRGLTAEAAERFVRSDVEAPERWATATVDALRAAGVTPTADTVCQVLAVIEQESGYDPSPEVPGLGRLAAAALEQEAVATLGLLGEPTLHQLLDVAPDGEPTFRDRLDGVRREEELDRWYRDLVAYHEGRIPLAGSAVRLLFPRLEERLHPVATVGSMQVSAQWAQAHPTSRGLDRHGVRDRLYTLEGGVHYGTLRLFATDAYAAPIHRFADFNAGPQASRNAAFQAMVAELAGTPLQRDGDLLQWNDRGRPRRRQTGETVAALQALAPELGLAPDTVLRDLRHEKEVDFRSTPTWAAVRRLWTERTGRAPLEAQVPEVVLDSPKLSGTWTTATFAQRTRDRHARCVARGQ